MGKARSNSVTNLGYCGVESSGWFDISPKNPARAGVLLWWSCQSQVPIAAAFWIIQVVSPQECSSLMPNLMLICCSTLLAILNAIATQFTCSCNGVYCSHWLVQWSHHCSHMPILVHSPWLPGYIDVVETILIILTMAGFYPDRPCISE